MGVARPVCCAGGGRGTAGCSQGEEEEAAWAVAMAPASREAARVLLVAAVEERRSKGEIRSGFEVVAARGGDGGLDLLPGCGRGCDGAAAIKGLGCPGRWISPEEMTAWRGDARAAGGDPAKVLEEAC